MYNYFISSMMDCLVGPHVRTSATVGPTVAFASHRKKNTNKTQHTAKPHRRIHSIVFGYTSPLTSPHLPAVRPYYKQSLCIDNI